MSALGTFAVLPKQMVLCHFCGEQFPIPKGGMLGVALERHVREVHQPVGISAATASGWMIKDGVFEVTK